MNNGTDQIANHFYELSAGRVCFTSPGNTEGWLPKGFELVTDPEHFLAASDCVLPRLSNDWRVVGEINRGNRVGLKAKDAGVDILYIAKLKTTQRKVLPAGLMQSTGILDHDEWVALEKRKPIETDADFNGDVIFLRSGGWDCLGRVKSGIPIDATHWKPTGRK